MRTSLVLSSVAVLLVAGGVFMASDGGATMPAPQESNIAILNCAKPVAGLTEYVTHTCPVGGEVFEVLTFTGVKPQIKTMDLRPVSEFMFPAPLAVCPSNGFVIDKSEYSDEELEARKKVLSDPTYQEVLSRGLPTHTIALEYLSRLPLEISDEVEFDVPYMALQAAWEAEACGSELYSEVARTAAFILDAEVRSSETPIEQRFAYAPAVPDLARKAGLFEASIYLIENTCNCIVVPAVEVLLNKVRKAAEAGNTSDIIVSPDDPELAPFLKKQ